MLHGSKVHKKGPKASQSIIESNLFSALCSYQPPENMNTKLVLALLNFVLLHLVLSIASASPAHDTNGDFVQCLISKTSLNQETIYTPSSPAYYPTLDFSIQNLRFATPSTPKPQFIVTPLVESHVQAAIYCAKKNGLEIRVRCGGHDFEGQSYVAMAPFVLVDLLNMRSISIDVESATAWAQGGATQGELYFAIANASRTLAFPGGEYPTVGIGGFISGGGYGLLQRKYGLAADNVIDALFMDVNGAILDRESMGEDLFWAIRGGGGGNFGVVLAWKLQLVPVPEKVTIFRLTRTIDQKETQIIYKWQSFAANVPEDLFIRLGIGTTSQDNNTVVQVSYESIFLGGVDELLQLMQEGFPEFGLVREDCNETSWIEAIMIFDGLSSLDDLLNRYYTGKTYNKFKGDFVQEPIPIEGLEGLWEVFLQEDPGIPGMAWSPYGGKMSEISESAIPFPHRAGNLYFIFEAAIWTDASAEAAERHLNWSRKLYEYMTPYVSKSPRGAYVNYKDLDLGLTNKETTPEQARSWGIQYFGNNYDRLVDVKTTVDPENFFRNDQSIPPSTKTVYCG